MAVGWLAFCMTFPLMALAVCWIEGRGTYQLAGVWLAFAIYSLPVVLLAWLLVLFPVDCLLPADSALRKVLPAGIIGFLVGPLPFLVLSTYQHASDFATWTSKVERLMRDADTWLYFGGASITGLAAALHLAIKHPPLGYTHTEMTLIP